ncbi:MAG: 50S ribosomal protein L18 [Planctomycetota bacterium]
MSILRNHQHRLQKQNRVRARLRRSLRRPRLSVFRSLKNISCQIIDDSKGHTLVSASSLEKEVRTTVKGLKKSDVAKKVGALLAERAKQAGVTEVAFDRGAYRYHGRVKALAEAAREGGLVF